MTDDAHDDDLERLLKKVAHVPSPTPPSSPPPPPSSPPAPLSPSAKGRPSSAATAAAAAAAAASTAAASAMAAVSAPRARASESSSFSGRLIAGRYHLGRQLGAGGMGTVYEASDEVLRRSVAVKLVLDQAPTDDTIARFKREAQAAAALSDPSIVTVHDFGVDGDLPYIVMERVQGTPLYALMKGQPQPWQRALSLVSSIARALTVAHAAGVIHRDLKPANVIVVDESRNHVKLVDFGVSRLRRRAHESDDGLIVGTPGYIAPELARDGDLEEPRADVYALGVIAFTLLTGRPPFDAPTPHALLDEHATAAPPAPSSSAPHAGIPPAVDDFVLALLRKTPARRPHAREIEPVIAGLLALLTPSSSSPSPSPPKPRTNTGAAESYKARYVQDVLAEMERLLPKDKLDLVLAGADAAFIAKARAATAVENLPGPPLWQLYKSMRAVLGDDAYLAWWRTYTLKLIQMPLWSGLMSGVVKLLGLTPHAVFKNLPHARGSLVRSGGVLKYERVDDGAARLTLDELPQELMDAGITGLTMGGVYEGLVSFVGREGRATIELEDARMRRVVHVVRWRT